MSKYNYAPGAIHIDHHKDLNIDVKSVDDAIRLMSAFMSDRKVEDVEPVKENKASDTSTIPPDFFCISARFTEENIRERLAAELSQATTKKDYCRGLYRLQHIGCINIDQYASDAQRADVFNRFQSKYDLSANDFCKARMN